MSKITSSFTVAAEPSGLRFALDVTNVGKKNVELAFPDGQTHDFAVLNAQGLEVYRWGEHHMFTQSVQNRLIDGGNTMRVAEHASTDLPPGEYVAVATLRSTNFPVQERVTFQVR
ncbi:MAG: BsuPI-related putative proteinase inhibitor [Gemmatimonadaceae bacterium]